MGLQAVMISINFFIFLCLIDFSTSQSVTDITCPREFCDALADCEVDSAAFEGCKEFGIYNCGDLNCGIIPGTSCTALTRPDAECQCQNVIFIIDAVCSNKVDERTFYSPSFLPNFVKEASKSSQSSVTELKVHTIFVCFMMLLYLTIY